MHKMINILMVLLLFAAMAYSQGKFYEGPDDPAGDISEERAGYMNGNRVMLYFENNTQLADYPRINTSKWPNDYSGTRMLDVVSVMIGGEVYLQNDSIPIMDFDKVAELEQTGEIDTLFYIQSTGFAPSNMDQNYDGTVEWGFYPVPGYMNPLQDYPAMSNKADSWPLDGWPAAGRSTKWVGEWNGRFGRGIQYADLETYFVANDAQDMEYIIQRNDPEENVISEGPRYYPRPAMHIGDVNPNVTIQRGYPWGGLGLRVEVRGFQWNNPEAKDMIFWEYGISNISDYDLITCGFGYFIDNSIGGDTGGDKEEGYFSDLLDLSYVWESIGVGEGGFTPGIIGMAYLESPGKPYDDIDNDDDGLINEKRDNKAGNLVGAQDNIDNLDNFLNFYHYTVDDLHPHYEGDEDQDWEDGVDLNGNGTYAVQGSDGLWYVEEGEYAGDDVGLDGVGPSDLNYSGPDEGECNHMPDYIEGMGCEPNFAATDVSEADMVGLTAFTMFDYPQWQDMNYMLGQDKTMWTAMDAHNLGEYVFFRSTSSLYEVFGSTAFPFYKGRTERISMGMLFAYEALPTLQSSTHEAPKMFRLKETAQVIYERDYRFAQPPIMPTLAATPLDNKVILTWDDLSDKRTHEPFLQNVNDFEGYKLYRATDKMFSDAEIITTGQGDKMHKLPIYQCDLKDNINGYANYGLVEGSAFYLGDDTGIKHHYVDTDVQNGVTYYYAIVAYDYGVDDLDVSPTENNIVIELDEAEEIVRMGQNVAVVTPRTPAAGYVPSSIIVDEDRSTERLVNGMITPHIVDPQLSQQNHTYRVTFNADTVDYLRSERYRHPADALVVTNALQVWDEVDNKLVYEENSDSFLDENMIYDSETAYWHFQSGVTLSTDLFEGLQLDFIMPDDSVYLDMENSGWITGDAPIMIQTGEETSYFPWEYEIVFTGDELSYQTRTSVLTSIRASDGHAIKRDSLLLDESFNFYVLNKMYTDSTGAADPLDLIVYDLNESGAFEWQEDVVLAGHCLMDGTRGRWCGTIFTIDFRLITAEEVMPQANDVYTVKLHRPLTTIDNFYFKVNQEQEANKENLKTSMDSIKVVPNPYIATNAMEPAVGNKYLNQRRRIMFTHIPAACDIHIFTSSGILVAEIPVDNEPSNGIIHWDVLSREGLEISAGMYIFHVKSRSTGYEKLGKFAVIK